MAAEQERRGRILWLEHTANLLTCLVVMVGLGMAASRWSPTFKAGHDEPTRTKVGDNLSSVVGLEPGAATSVILAVIRSDCGQCTAHATFLRRLQLTAAPGQVRFVLAAPADDSGATAFRSKNNLEEFSLLRLAKGALNVKGVPTTMLLDRRGNVKQVFVGTLTEDHIPVVSNSLASLN